VRAAPRELLSELGTIRGPKRQDVPTAGPPSPRRPNQSWDQKRLSLAALREASLTPSAGKGSAVQATPDQ